MCFGSSLETFHQLFVAGASLQLPCNVGPACCVLRLVRDGNRRRRDAAQSEVLPTRFHKMCIEGARDDFLMEDDQCPVCLHGIAFPGEQSLLDEIKGFCKEERAQAEGSAAEEGNRSGVGEFVGDSAGETAFESEGDASLGKPTPEVVASVGPPTPEVAARVGQPTPADPASAVATTIPGQPKPAEQKAVVAEVTSGQADPSAVDAVPLESQIVEMALAGGSSSDHAIVRKTDRCFYCLEVCDVDDMKRGGTEGCVKYKCRTCAKVDTAPI